MWLIPNPKYYPVKMRWLSRISKQMLIHKPHKACLNYSCICLSNFCSPQCDFLSSEEKGQAVFSPSSLRLAACDLQQLMTTFCHVYQTDLRAYCSRDPPSFSADADIFQKVHQLLLACNTVSKPFNIQPFQRWNTWILQLRCIPSCVLMSHHICSC